MQVRYALQTIIRLPSERLEYRLSYLTERFSKQAHYWQVMVWTRQVLLLLPRTYE